jgi:phosphopantetheinyl transferase (holo-ACP synthase)
LDLVGAQFGQSGTEPAEIFFCDNGNEKHQFLTGFFVLKESVTSAVNKV